MIYDPRFLPTIDCSHAVALHFAHCGQLTAGLAPAGMRPCWAHKQERADIVGPFYTIGRWWMN